MSDQSSGDTTDVAPSGDIKLLQSDAGAIPEIPPDDMPIADTDNNYNVTVDTDKETATTIMETETLTSSSIYDHEPLDGACTKLLEGDDVADKPSSTPAEVQPTIATISAIVNEVRRQRKSGADIASIASREVNKIFDDGNRQVEFEEKPSERQTYALYNRNLQGEQWNGNKYSDDVDREDFTHNHPSSFMSNKTADGDSIMDDFSDLCEELGIKDISHPQLLRITRRRYQILPGSLLRSTPCHYCMIITCLAGIALIVASAVTKGFNHVQKRDHALHPAWAVEEDTTKKKEGTPWWIEENDNDDKSLDLLGSAKVDNSKRLSPDELEQYSYALSDAYLPIWFDQSTGWKGASYDEAVAFCKSHYKFVPCPYEVYCPEHGGQLIFNEVFEDNKSSWAPVKDSWNEWVQVGNVGTQCSTYSETFNQTPDFGSMNSAATESFSSQIMCCLDQPLDDVTLVAPITDTSTDGQSGVSSSTAVSSHAGAGNSSPPSDTLSAMVKFLNPIWYSTNIGGWPGGSYDDAVQFCVEKGHSLCPRTIVCPMGPTFPPIEGAWVTGAADKSPEQWVPVIDQPNHWLMIGSLDNNESRLCMDYETLNGNEPAWGLDRSEPGLKRHICCTDNKVTSVSQEVQGGTSITTSQNPVPQQTNFDYEVDETDTGPMTSTWFRMGDGGGWNGGSHDDAIHFCAMKKIDGKRMGLCPYHAYCPSGPSQPPYDGNYMTDDGDDTEQWAPMSTGENSWVLVGMHGRNKASQCLTYGILNGSEPSWGLDGSNTEKKLHVLCCAT